ncbi:MAG: NERD domain-containing protein [Dolichospermum sp. DET50]|nr:NERD domain-containing protein [Dolichospermum sp. DET66]MBS3033959.1 NERD domain-containing protein [Dolichospermum sp. DET67]MBS3039162.1 NERD domain-containing protein [Dolichospermum sp. DET50]QSX66402.1 MAG: NERD domain-containing protein [Dolichospermum sp. DET69]
MSTLIPSFNSCSMRMTPGERRLAQRMEEKLDDDYLLWYDVPIGKKQLHPDFIVLHPSRGLFILEVKDWKLDTIQNINPSTFTIITDNGIKEVKHPLQQARDYALAVNKLLEKDTALVQQGDYQGKLIIPYGYGVVFTNINRKDFNNSELPTVFEEHLVICKDEILPSTDAGEFQQRLWYLLAYNFGKILTNSQIDRIRWHIFPELRITQLSLFDVEIEEPQHLQIPDILQIMDLQQEQLARSLGDGHRIIHGVAGSGKTMILGFRCQHLAQLNKPILVLCFNVSLAAKLRDMIQKPGKVSRIKVRHFHGWCMDLLKKYNIPKPDPREYQGESYIEELVNLVINAVDAKLIPSGIYDAVMLDEGHDFKPEWLKLIAQMVNPETNSLLVLYDDAQNLYGSKRNKFSFKSVGIQAQGRSTILKLNYRNTEQVLGVAYEFAKEVMIPTTGDDDQVILVEPASAGRQGPMPDLIKLSSFQQEVDYLAQRVQQLHERGTPWNEIAIIYRSYFMGNCIFQDFQKMHIPIEWVNANNNSRNYNPAQESIKLITMHSSKGLEFPIVLIPGLGYMPNENQELGEEARLIYVAMTRAMEQLIITCHRSSEFTNRIESALSKVTK